MGSHVWVLAAGPGQSLAMRGCHTRNLKMWEWLWNWVLVEAGGNLRSVSEDQEILRSLLEAGWPLGCCSCREVGKVRTEGKEVLLHLAILVPVVGGGEVKTSPNELRISLRRFLSRMWKVPAGFFSLLRVKMKSKR